MTISELLLPEFDQEMSVTRTVLERVPEDKFEFKPHPKSGTMIWLATHVANLPLWATTTLTGDSLDVAPEGAPPMTLPKANSRQELLDLFDRHAAAARQAIAATSDAEFQKPWSLRMTGKTLFTLPRVAVVRRLVLNHLIHHRAQLIVYLRLNNIPVPAIYGPSADENKMF
jgi:uncharacterized damage-inducible protein DinB